MRASEDDEFDRDEEFDEQEEREEEDAPTVDNDDDDEDEEAEADGKTATMDERFIERIPEKVPPVTVLPLRLPPDLIARAAAHQDRDDDSDHLDQNAEGEEALADGHAAATAGTVPVQVRLTRPAYRFEQVCRKALDAMRRAHVMHQLAHDVDGLRAFVTAEHARQRAREEQGLTLDDELAQGIAPDALEAMDAMLEKIQLAGAGLAMPARADAALGDDEDNDGAGTAPVRAPTTTATDGEMEDGEPKAPLYWLAPLLANDLPTLERTLAGMYGWAVPPPPPPRPPRSVSFATGSGRRAPGDANHDDDDEEGEEVIVPDPARARPSWFKPSGAFGNGDASHHESGEEEDNGAAQDDGGDDSTGVSAALASGNNDEVAAGVKDQGSTRPSGDCGSHQANMVVAPPLTAVPAFGDVNRRLWVVFDTVSAEWHLLDVHPLLHALRCRTEKRLDGAESADAAEEADGDARGDAEEPGEDEEDDGDDGDTDTTNSDDGSADRRRRGRLAGVPEYDLNTMLPVDAVVLSALLCPSALRLCLLQRRRPSLECVETWLRRDLHTGFPILAAVHAAIVTCNAVDGPRLPYALPSMRLDYNLFFEEPFVGSGDSGHGLPLTNYQASQRGSTVDGSTARDTPALAYQTASSTATSRGFLLTSVNLSVSPFTKHLLCRERQVSLISSSLSHVARFNMEMLLAAGVFPSRPIRQAAFDTSEGVRLALWLLMSVPRATLTRWGYRDGTMPGERGRADADDSGDEAALAAEEADWYGFSGNEGNGRDGRGNQDGSEEASDEDADDDIAPEDETVEAVCERVARMHRREAQERRAQEGHLLRVAPFAMEVILEVRRRVAREMKTKPPSQHTLLTSLERVYKPAQIEDGKPRGDPLLTSRFLLALPVPVTGMKQQNGQDESAKETVPATSSAPVSGEAAEGRADAHTHAVDTRGALHFRHQRLYQSDIVLLLLALTSTPQPRGMVTACGASAGLFKKPSPPSKRAAGGSVDGPGAAHRLGLSDATLAASGQQAAFTAVAQQAQQESHSSFSLVEPSAAVSLRRRSLMVLQGTPSDAHEALFTELLALKLDKATKTPITLLRSGTVRLLLRALPRFRHPRLMQAFCEVVPLYQALGESETAPLPALVRDWSAELARALKREHVTGMVQHRYLDAFTNRFWHELHCRFTGGLYADVTVALMRRQLMVLFDKVDERLRQYQDAIASLGGIVHIDHALYFNRTPGGAGTMSTSATQSIASIGIGGGGAGSRLGEAMASGTRRFTARTMSLMSASPSLMGTAPADLNYAPAGGNVLAADARGRKSLRRVSQRVAAPGGHRRSSLSTSTAGAATGAAPGRIGGRQLALYDTEFKRELTRVRSVFSGLSMQPTTYLTPYTLFALLFDADEDVNASPVLGKSGVAGGGSARSIDLAAVYYLVVVQGVTTVRTDPFFGADMPALEYAVRELNLPAARTLVQLGASLDELIEGGAMTVEQYCELMFTPDEVEELRLLADMHTHYVTTNPDAYYGILRNMRAAAVGV